MKLYLVRHGDYTMDTLKQLDVLTEKGIRDIEALTQFLKPLEIQVSAISHSGKFRAYQTAELLAKGFQCDQTPQETKGLNPNDDVATIADSVMQRDEDVLLVGHLPFMGRLVSHLMLGNENKELVNFQTGTMVCLEFIEHQQWIINWILIPDLLSTANT